MRKLKVSLGSVLRFQSLQETGLELKMRLII